MIIADQIVYLSFMRNDDFSKIVNPYQQEIKMRDVLIEKFDSKRV